MCNTQYNERLQAAMTLRLDEREESAAHMNLISNHIMETNITVNWTGGGQINECRHSSLPKFHELQS